MGDLAVQHQPPPQGVVCPKCDGWLETLSQIGRQGRITCSKCKWTGEVRLYDPLPRQIEQAQQAMDADARCAFHQSKKAASICSGTGDYICSLCAVKVDGQTYSATYIDLHGQAKIQDHFSKELARPDRITTWMIVLCLFPYPLIASPVTLPIGMIQWWKMVKQRQQNPSYRNMVGMTSVVISGFLLLLLTLALIGGFIAIVVAIFNEM